MSDALDHALHYAARGWRVVPIPPGHKHPAGITAWQTKATTDPERIRRHWAANPTHGVGIATGPESGLFVVDIDPADGGDDSLAVLEQRFGPMPDTVEAVTGGDGRHIAFRWPDGVDIHNSASGQLGAGIDVRGIGGLIVAAPTIHPGTGRRYAWEVEHDPLSGQALADAPPWLLQLLTTAPGAATARRDPIPRGPGDDLPGDVWAAATTWADELEHDGWQLHSTHVDATGGAYELWTRPGKDVRDGASASLYWRGSNVLKVFSSRADPLEANQTYTLWGYHVAVRHGGDFQAAARAQRRAMQLAAVTDIPTVTAAVVGAATTGARTAIVHNGRQLDEVVLDAVGALAAANHPPTMFVRAGQLARLRQDEDDRPLIEALRSDHVRLSLSESATWWRAHKDGGLVATSPPVDVAATVLARGEWPFPALAGVVELPVLRHDGTFATDHGYDAHTRLYHWHRGKPYAAVPEAPTPEELAGSVAMIDDLLGDFPWDTAADRANAWALLLTPLVRAIVGQVPMALIDAPEPGTGKGLLVKACSIVTTGRAAALMAWPSSEEELEKKVTAALMNGSTVVVFDNVEGVIKSPTLAAVLTADSWQGRILGRSEMVLVPNRATWAATGNNIDVGGDLARRCYRIRLDARQAQPWLRTGFRHTDLEGWALAQRGELLHALCTIVRSWWVAGRPQATTLPAMGGYASWVRTIGGILAHAGVGHFLANLADFHASADREAASWEAFLTQWHDELGEEAVTVADLIAKMREPYGLRAGELRDALPDDLSGYLESPGFARRLGLALRKRCGRHYGGDGLHLVEMPRDRRAVAIYSVTRRDAGVEPAERGSAGVAPVASENSPDAAHRAESRAGLGSERGSTAGVEPTPARHDSVTSTDGIDRGSAGVVGGATREKKISTGSTGAHGFFPPSTPNNSRDSRTPAVDDEELF